MNNQLGLHEYDGVIVFRSNFSVSFDNGRRVSMIWIEALNAVGVRRRVSISVDSGEEYGGVHLGRWLSLQPTTHLCFSVEPDSMVLKVYWVYEKCYPLNEEVLDLATDDLSTANAKIDAWLVNATKEMDQSPPQR